MRSNPLNFLLTPGRPDRVEWEWATVSSTDPLRIQVDGDPAPLAGSPQSLVAPANLHPGKRVWVQFRRAAAGLGQTGAQPIIIGPSNTEVAYSWTPVPLVPGWEEHQGLLVSRTGRLIMLRGSATLLTGGITDDQWYPLGQLPEWAAPPGDMRMPLASTVSDAALAQQVLAVNVDGTLAVGRATGPAGVATGSYINVAATWLQ